jgi:putative peptidoglycan lipid II flippase
MFLWSAQAIYARAFYAAGNTMAPMVAGTAVTVVSLPIYYALYHLYGATGLAVASNIGIALQTVTIALLLHQRHMVSLASLDYSELGRCLLAAIASGAGVWIAVWAIDTLLAHLPGTPLLHHTRLTDFAVLLAGTAIWLAVTKAVLEKSGSALPKVAMKRLGLA